MPKEQDIERVMRETGMDRMQAINHLRGRALVQQTIRRSVTAAMKAPRK
jgi:hypothetical protein